jgi:hypothetical protein
MSSNDFIYEIKGKYYICLETKKKMVKVALFLSEDDDEILNKRLSTLEKSTKLEFNIENVKKTCHDYAEFDNDVFELNENNEINLSHHDGDEYILKNWNDWRVLMKDLLYKYF